jgi:hypothetical protein
LILLGSLGFLEDSLLCRLPVLPAARPQDTDYRYRDQCHRVAWLPGYPPPTTKEAQLLMDTVTGEFDGRKGRKPVSSEN